MISLFLFVCLMIIMAKDLRIADFMRVSFLLILFISMFINIPRDYFYVFAGIFAVVAVYAIFAPNKIYPVMKHRSFMKKWVQHPFEAFGYKTFSGFIRLVPLPIISYVGGKLLEWVGPLTKADKITRMNLAAVMPENNNDRFIKKMWNNWGRVFAEGFHISTYAKNMDKYVSIKNKQLMDKAVNGGGFIVCIPHTGLMGLFTLLFEQSEKCAAGVTFRFPTNPLSVDFLTENYGKNKKSNITYIPIGNARLLYDYLGRGGVISVNPDHRVGSGATLDFFGLPAKTSTGTARLARKFDIPVLVARVERIGGVKHRIVFDELLTFKKTSDEKADELRDMQKINDAMERAIKKSPAEYLWMHKRWGTISGKAKK